MILRFNFKKGLQAAAVLLHLDGKRMECVRLLKLLYIADREMLKEAGHSITGDTGFAMDDGPVLTRIYDCIKGTDVKAAEWEEFIHSEAHAVALAKEPGRDELSRAEVEKLTEVANRFRDRSEWEISEMTRDFPEWKAHFRAGTSSRIPWEEVLQAQDAAEMIPVVEEEEAVRAALGDLFGDRG